MQRRGITRAIQEYLYAKESPKVPAQARAFLPQAMYTQFTKSVHRRFVHSVFQTRGDYTPTRAPQCANVVWSDLGLERFKAGCTASHYGPLLRSRTKLASSPLCEPQHREMLSQPLLLLPQVQVDAKACWSV